MNGALWVLLLSGILGFRVGMLGFPDWQVAVETAQVLAGVRRIKDAGIKIIANYILGLPEDTPDSMQRTLDLALDLNCEFANFYSAMAYPGSPL